MKKTTVILPDALVAEARRTAARERTTLRALIEEGLRDVLERRHTRVAYELPDASVGGRGLQAPFQSASWESIRDAAYGVHGE